MVRGLCAFEDAEGRSRASEQGVQSLLELPDVKERLASQGVEVGGSTPEELNAVVQSERKLWTRVVREAGIRVE